MPAGMFSSGCHQFTGGVMSQSIQRLLRDERGQDIAEDAVMLAVILVIVVGTVRLIGSNANNGFSQMASSIQSAMIREVGSTLPIAACDSPRPPPSHITSHSHNERSFVGNNS